MMFLIKTIQNYTSYPANASNAIINGTTGFGDVFKSAWDNSTSSNALKSLAVSGLSPGITTGLTNKLNLDIQNSLTDALKESALSTSTLLQSTINCDSFSEALKNQAINTVVGTLANLTAKEIGSNYHSGKINKGEQLFLHALLGATANELTGNDALSGALSGVSAEVFTDIIGNVLYGTTSGNELTKDQKDTLKNIGGLTGGLTSIIVSRSQGNDVREITNNAYSGQRIGQNAVENNLTYDQLLGDSRTTSEYTEEIRKVKELNIARPHKGVDTIPEKGNNNTKVHVSADGTIIYTEPQRDKETGKLKGWGNQVVVEHVDEDGNKYLTRYAHLKEKSDIPVGTKVKEGQPIGTMGNTGGSAGAHLHYELLEHDSKTNTWKHVDPTSKNIGKYKYLKDTPYQQNLRKK